MNARRAPRGTTRRTRLAWVVFCGVAGLVLGYGVFFALESGNRADVVLTLFGGLLVVGLAALLMGSILNPDPDGPSGSLGSRWGGGFEGGSGGWSDGGGGGGDGGGGC